MLKFQIGGAIPKKYWTQGGESQKSLGKSDLKQDTKFVLLKKLRVKN